VISVRKGFGAFCVLVAYTDPKEVSGASKEPLRDALCRAAQWLKSSPEKLSEKSR
jgi:hypothetical protein